MGSLHGVERTPQEPTVDEQSPFHSVAPVSVVRYTVAPSLACKSIASIKKNALVADVVRVTAVEGRRPRRKVKFRACTEKGPFPPFIFYIRDLIATK